MDISIFDVAGPVMIGPSSSHTAGAARLARIARMIVAKPFHRVVFGLHGSFAKTYKGHGTDKALVAGALGLREDDERLSEAFSIADNQGLAYEFLEVSLDDMHENSVEMTFFLDDGSAAVVTGSSIGGARIIIRRVDDFPVEFAAESSALLISQEDRRGVVSEITRALAESGINIGVMRLSRTGKGDRAFCVIETDDAIGGDLLERIRGVRHVISAQAVNIGPEE